ncbi:hypothetical protein F4556_007366 [Kitasatospora gansuensis]|uniref:Uncharacterized protein n=1 Tax=Kitasatospora gansuensis TaxID=258050 RepID=A0A7W7SJW9_9ACTN|nr:hypothetical protein [Kitasatospora gansuensis]MBB4951831.1 hypothetical protein [Kitasatospora gansuensis]
MADDSDWTIDRIAEGLRSPALRNRFLSELNRTPEGSLAAAFARWKAVAQDLEAAADQARTLLADGPSALLADESVDITDQVLTRAERLRTRAA